MKRVLVAFIIGILSMVSAFAVELNIKEGISLCDAGITITDDTEKHLAGSLFTPGNFTEVNLSDKYFDILFRTTNTIGLNTIDASGTLQYDFSGIKPYVSVNYKLCTVGTEYVSNWNYLDMVAGAVFTVDKDWIKISGDVNFGWCFIYAVDMNKWNGHFSSDRNNVTTTTLGVTIELFDIVELFASMQSYQMFGFPTFEPTSVNNKIGIKAHYNFNKHWAIFGEISHYCKHPEKPASSDNFSTYADTTGTTAVLGVQFSL